MDGRTPALEPRHQRHGGRHQHRTRQGRQQQPRPADGPGIDRSGLPALAPPERRHANQDERRAAPHPGPQRGQHLDQPGGVAHQSRQRGPAVDMSRQGLAESAQIERCGQLVAGVGGRVKGAVGQVQHQKQQPHQHFGPVGSSHRCQRAPHPAIRCSGSDRVLLDQQFHDHHGRKEQERALAEHHADKRWQLPGQRPPGIRHPLPALSQQADPGTQNQEHRQRHMERIRVGRQVEVVQRLERHQHDQHQNANGPPRQQGHEMGEQRQRQEVKRGVEDPETGVFREVRRQQRDRHVQVVDDASLGLRRVVHEGPEMALAAHGDRVVGHIVGGRPKAFEKGQALHHQVQQHQREQDLAGHGPALRS